VEESRKGAENSFDEPRKSRMMIEEEIRCSNCGEMNKALISFRGALVILELCECCKKALQKRKELAGIHEYDFTSALGRR
jgi:hypothetical protein